MGNLSGKDKGQVFSQSDVLEQTSGTYGQDFDHTPTPPKKTKEQLLKKINFDKIDRTALDAPPELLLEQFWDISDHLVVSKSFDVIDDIYRIRAIFRWMTSFDIDSIMTQILPPDSCPLEYLLKIQSDFGDHAHLLYVLCVAANIPCVVINGMTKHGLYEVGDELNRDVLLSKWNAVFVNGEWRLIDPHWAVSVPEGTYRDQIFVDDEGNISVTDEFGNKEGEDRPVNEFFFLCDPQKMIWTHFPDEEKWQLLEKPISEKRFQDQPYVREYFHTLNLTISSEYPETDNCILRPDGRPSRIAFNLPVDIGKHLSFKFTINEVDVDIGDERDPSELERNVMMEKSDSSLRFTARFPFIGRFQLDIYGCDQRSDMTFRLLCTYLIHCGKICKNCKGFPKVPDHGWGPHPLAAKVGLVPISPKSNTITTETGIVEVRLPSKMCNNMCHALKSMAFDDALLSNHAIGRFDNDQYFVNMRLPEAGEYTLEIFADVDQLKGKLPDTKVMTFLVEFIGDSTNAPFPVVLGSHLGKKPFADKLQIKAKESANGVIMAWEGKLSLQFDAENNIKMFNELSSNDTTARKLMKIDDKQENGAWVFDLDLPLPGIYSLNLYAWDDDEQMKKMHEVFSYLIQSTGYITKEELEKQRKSRKNKRNKRTSSRSPRRTDTTDVVDSKTNGSKEEADETLKDTTNDKMGKEDSAAIPKDNDDPFSGMSNDIAGISGMRAAPAATSFMTKSKEIESKRSATSSKNDAAKNQPPGNKSVVSDKNQEHLKQISLRGKGSGLTGVQDKTKAEQRSKTQLTLKRQQTGQIQSATGTHSKTNSQNDTNKSLNNKSKDLSSEKKKTLTSKQNTNDNNKGVTFGSEALESLIVKTFVTSENILHIPIEQPLNTIFTSLRRRDANEKHGDKVMVVKQNQGLEFRIKGYGEYQLDVMWKGDGTKIAMVGRYTVIRKPARGNKTAQSMTTSKLFGSGFVDASVWNSDGTNIKAKEKKKKTVSEEKVEQDKIVPDLRSIKSSDMYDDDTQERFTEATNREMMAKLRKSMNVKDLTLVLKYMELYHSTTKSARGVFPKSIQNLMKKIKKHQRVVMECRMDEPVVIEEAIDVKKRSDDKGMLEITLVVAHKIIDRASRKQKCTKMELEINQITLTEIKQYSNPPDGVHECMMATLLLLGDNIEDLQDFSACQGLLFRTGHNYVMRRIAQFDSKTVPVERVEMTKSILGNYSVWQIMDVSKGAAAFFMWVRAMIQEVENRKRPFSSKSRAASSKSRSSKRIAPRATVFPEYISRRDGTIIMKL